MLAVLSETEGLLCGGAILNETEILTAGHCVYNPTTRTKIPADQIVVGAGTADLNIAESEEQASLASLVRVHPYYLYDPEATQAAPDDVAVLALAKPFVLDAAVKPIALVSAGSPLGEGTAVNLTGFGEENPLIEELNGQLHSLGMTLGFSRECGGEANALFLCASSPTGSDCFGDSGSGLTVPGSPPALAGVTDTTEVIDGRPCVVGSLGGFANVAAPEIRDFVVADDPTPPLAPRGGGTSIYGVPTIGNTLRCEHGAWSNSPTFSYEFVNAADRQVLQQGSSSTYVLTSADLGRAILCEVLATNAGGTGIGRTPALAAVRHTLAEEEAAAKQKQEEEAAAKKHEEEEVAAAQRRQQEQAGKGGVLSFKEASPDVTLAKLSLYASRNGAVSIELSCPAAASSCAGTVTLRTLEAVLATAKRGFLRLASGSFAIHGGGLKTITLHLSSKARALLARSHLLRVRATIVARSSTGATHIGYAVAVLHAAKAGHGHG